MLQRCLPNLRLINIFSFKILCPIVLSFWVIFSPVAPRCSNQNWEQNKQWHLAVLTRCHEQHRNWQLRNEEISQNNVRTLAHVSSIYSSLMCRQHFSILVIMFMSVYSWSSYDGLMQKINYFSTLRWDQIIFFQQIMMQLSMIAMPKQRLSPMNQNLSHQVTLVMDSLAKVSVSVTFGRYVNF